MEWNLPIAVGLIGALIAAGTLGLIGMVDGMTTETTLMMVLPSMVAFAAVVFVVGVKHGQYRAA